MRKIAIALATTASVVALPAMARDDAWYIGAEFGGMALEHSDFDVNGENNAIRVDFDEGADGALFAGYDLGGFRFEGEVGYKRARLNEIGSTYTLPGGAFAGARDAGGGHATAFSAMLNGIIDFGDDDGVSGFVGGGVGLGDVDMHNLRAFSNGPAFLDGSDTGIAWQVFAGLRQAISDNLDVSVKYRFFNVENLDYEFGGDSFDEGRFRSHSLLGGITYNFGAPPPPPPPPPPPAPQMQTCPNGTRIPVNQVCPAPPPPPPARTGENG